MECCLTARHPCTAKFISHLHLLSHRRPVRIGPLSLAALSLRLTTRGVHPHPMAPTQARLQPRAAAAAARRPAHAPELHHPTSTQPVSSPPVNVVFDVPMD